MRTVQSCPVNENQLPLYDNATRGKNAFMDVYLQPVNIAENISAEKGFYQQK